MTISGVVRFIVDNANSTQCALFLAVVVSLWIVERAATAQPAAEKLWHTSINIVYLAGVVPVQLLMMLICVSVANWTGRAHWGLVYFLPQNPLVRYGVMFFALDFLDYVYHFAAHKLRPLWSLHLIHHSDEAVDVSTTFREHPAETLVRVCFLTLWVFLCGASVEILVLRQTFETFANVSQHTIFRLPEKWSRRLGWIFVTPNLHHMHHHWQRPGTDCNYGDVFSIWDRLFGTYVDPAGERIRFGLDTHVDKDLSGLPRKILVGLSAFSTAAYARLRREGYPEQTRGFDLRDFANASDVAAQPGV